MCSTRLRPDALAERGDDGAPDHGVRLETLPRHQELVQLRQPIEGNARVPMMLEVKADVARQDEDDSSLVGMVLRVMLYSLRRFRRRCARRSGACTGMRYATCKMARANTRRARSRPRRQSRGRRPTRRTRAARRSSSAATGSTMQPTRPRTIHEIPVTNAARRSNHQREAEPASWGTPTRAPALPRRCGCARAGGSRRLRGSCTGDACRGTCGSPRPTRTSATSKTDWRRDRSASACADSDNAKRRGPL